MEYRAEIKVVLKDGIRDVQGSAVETVLKRIGLVERPKVCVGKFFTIDVNAENEDEAQKKFEKIANEVLSNPVLEQYEIIGIKSL